MDQRLNISHPPLKRAFTVFSSLKKSSTESHIQFLDRVKRTLVTGGLGTQEAFDLSWDRFIIILTIKGLPDVAQLELLKITDTFYVNLDNLQRFLDTFLTASSSSKNNINKISISKKVTKK